MYFTSIKSFFNLINPPYIYPIIKANKMENLKISKRWMMDAFLSRQQFEKDLEESLTIISYPNSRKQFYVCEHISASCERRMVNVHVDR